MRKRVLLSFLVVALAAFIAVGSAGAGTAPNRLDDNRGNGNVVGLAADVCNAILGPFQALSWFDLDVCPDMHGRIVSHPHIWNIYAGDNWDSSHSAAFSKAAINDMTRKIIDTSAGSDYFGPAIHYGINPPTLAGSSENDGCTGAPDGTTNQVSIELWITCEVQAPGTGVPLPDNDTIYVIYLPETVDINNGPFGGTCDNFTAYHLQSMALTVDGPDFTEFPPFDAHFQSYPYAVIPLKCAKVMRDPANHGTVTSRGAPGDPLDADELTELASHQIIEAATDPISLGGWLDNSTLNLSGDFLKEGEAADICESGIGPAGDVREHRLENGIIVEPYWSNFDGQCVPLMRKLKPRRAGSRTGARLTSRALRSSVTRPRTPSTCQRPSSSSMAPARRGRSPRRCLAIRHPVRHEQHGRVDSDHDRYDFHGELHQAVPADREHVSGQRRPTVDHAEPVGRRRQDGQCHDGLVRPSGVDRYRFNGWSGDASDIFESTNVLMNAAKTATANYKLQHQITFQQTGIPAGVPWNVKVDGTDHAGPYSQWFRRVRFVDFSFQNPVTALTAGTRYAFVSASAKPLPAVRAVDGPGHGDVQDAAAVDRADERPPEPEPEHHHQQRDGARTGERHDAGGDVDRRRHHARPRR